MLADHKLCRLDSITNWQVECNLHVLLWPARANSHPSDAQNDGQQPLDTVLASYLGPKFEGMSGLRHDQCALSCIVFAGVGYVLDDEVRVL